jgi:hypothetical protein
MKPLNLDIIDSERKPIIKTTSKILKYVLLLFKRKYGIKNGIKNKIKPKTPISSK